MNLQENINRIKQVMGVVNEGLHDTSWENDEGNKITLMDLLDSTEDIPVSNISVEELKPHLLSWDGDEDEVKKIDSADLQYPVLIFVNDDGEFITIIDLNQNVCLCKHSSLPLLCIKLDCPFAFIIKSYIYTKTA